VHPLSTRRYGLADGRQLRPGRPAAPEATTYRCSLPGLTGFVAPRRAGPDHRRLWPTV